MLYSQAMAIADFTDEFGPELVLEAHDYKSGLKGILVIDNTALGPGKGGIRLTPTVSTEEVFRLARVMTWKNALAGLPFGGAKAGITADAKQLTKEQKKALIQSFAKAIKPLSPKRYIAGPDINTSEEEMRWYYEANGSWRSCTGKPADVCMELIGKPGEKCGIPHEYGSTGFGVAHATLVAAVHINMDIKQSTAAIEGFGNVGTFAAKHLSELGAKIIAVSDSKGAIYDQRGIDVNRLIEVKKSTGSVTNYEPSQKMPGKDIFGLEADIIIPSALPDAINKENVNKVNAKIVIEAANIPMREDIEGVLHKRGVLVVPDFAANAGGVISSYAEYRGYNPKRMFALVESKIRKNVAAVLKKAEGESVMPRAAAMSIAAERVRNAMSRHQNQQIYI